MSIKTQVEDLHQAIIDYRSTVKSLESHQQEFINYKLNLSNFESVTEHHLEEIHRYLEYENGLAKDRDKALREVQNMKRELFQIFRHIQTKPYTYFFAGAEWEIALRPIKEGEQADALIYQEFGNRDLLIKKLR